MSLPIESIERLHTQEPVRLHVRRPGPAITRYRRPRNPILLWSLVSLLGWGIALRIAVEFMDVKSDRVPVAQTRNW